MLNVIFRLSTLATAFDILIVAIVLYYIMLMVKGTRAERMLWGIGVIVIVYFVSLRAELVTLHWMLSNFLGSVVIFIIVVFQQDIRRALVHMGRAVSPGDSIKSREALDEIASAVCLMSESKTGSLIVIEREVTLGDFLDSGVEIDAKVSSEVLRTIFNVASLMHDGAVVVRGARIFKAGVILPLTEKELEKSLGTRHRAAIGLAEETDAVIIVVSEKTGDITLAVDGELYASVKPDSLLEDLKVFFPYTGDNRKTLFTWKAKS
ncbi:TIGR00159 family protein [bacterium]|nr:MAG: TIGR00159 family protein [bacterium]